MQSEVQKAVSRLQKADFVVVGSHTQPDGDAIGSTLALTLALRSIGIEAVPTLADGCDVPSTYTFLPGIALIVPFSELEDVDVFVALDTASFSRLGGSSILAESAASVIVVDHHADNPGFGSINVIDPSKAATAHLVWELLGPLGVQPTPEIALCCYTGLVTDTGRFSYSNTTAEALRCAAEMIESGVDPAETARLVYQELSPAYLALEARVLARLTLANSGRVAWSWCTERDFTETGATLSEIEGLPDAVRRIQGVDVVLMLRVLEGEIRGNLRSKTGFDVSSVARVFGGGGHVPAAGFTYNGSMQTLLDRLMPMLPGGDSAS
ncbi:MAG: bifunctional oligoribonuclease/PAP phosphatase NrnA [Actinobacteria bacterium]|nr:bifunctional oligoribonuclease/PAP phosphatase NrnA [Actinomycetota bacterium]MCL5887570.1 bifunctional oligoribonuclease/PAP phosphatase NrnA [Actinomycetota bacterium]